MTEARVSRVAAIGQHCKTCIYDPKAFGAWREQVAGCVASHCALHAVRPVPRNCLTNGRHNPAAIAAVRAKLDRAAEQQSFPPHV